MGKKTRRSYGRRPRSGRAARARIPILPAIGLGILGLQLATHPRTKASPNDNPLFYAMNKDWTRASQCATFNMTHADTYIPTVAILVADAVLRMVMGSRVPVGKKVTVL